MTRRPRSSLRFDVHPHQIHIGRIGIGVERIMLSGQAGRLHVSGGKVAADRLEWIRVGVLVNVNVYSTRSSSGDKLSSRDFIEAEVAKAAAAQPISLRCALITEHSSPGHKP
jgi:hypothetical protein